MHMLTYAKNVVTFEIGLIHRWKYTFSKRKFREEFKYATYFLLDGKLKTESDEILTYFKIKKYNTSNDIYCSAPLYSKTIVYLKFPCFDDPYYSEHIWCGLINQLFYGEIWGSINFSTFFKSKNELSTPNVIWDILYIEKLVVHPS